MAIIYTIANQKGGVGKTVTAQNFATGLSLQGKKVLVIDIDPQLSLSISSDAKLDYDDKSIPTILEVMQGQTAIKNVIQTTQLGYDILPSSQYLANIDNVGQAIDRPYLLQSALENIRNEYDYIIIDAPPALGTLTNNALIASDEVIIPACMEVFSLQGIELIGETIKSVRKRINPALKVTGILITRYQNRSRLGKNLEESFESMAQSIGTTVIKQRIRECSAIKESNAACRDIFHYDMKSNAAEDYLNAVTEIFAKK